MGILESHQGKGTFVRAIPAKAIAGKLNTLYQENKDMEDIYVSGLRVQGVATHVIKAL